MLMHCFCTRCALGLFHTSLLLLAKCLTYTLLLHSEGHFGKTPEDINDSKRTLNFLFCTDLHVYTYLGIHISNDY